MSFGPDHYVPVLKMKRGEKSALKILSANVRTRITPLLEVVERRGKPLPSHLDTAFKGLADCLHSISRCFIDALEIAPDGAAAAQEVFRRAKLAGLPFTPVTGIRRAADVEPAMKHMDNGLAMRVDRSDLEAGDLTARLQEFLASRELSPADIDMIVDLGAVETMVSYGIQALTGAFLTEIPVLSEWRTLTVSACAFPRSMGGVDRNSFKIFDREDWIAWRDGLHKNKSLLPRLPTYSDAGIQHPEGVEGYDPRIMPRSPSVRYASSDRWVLIKGQSTRQKPERDQYPKLASKLMNGELQKYFVGAQHCRGCESISASAGGASGLGSAEVWRRLGTVHHISTVVEALAALP